MFGILNGPSLYAANILRLYRREMKINDRIKEDVLPKIFNKIIEFIDKNQLIFYHKIIINYFLNYIPNKKYSENVYNTKFLSLQFHLIHF